MNHPYRFHSPVATILAGAILSFACPAQAPADKPVVTGKFAGDARDGNLQHLVVLPCDPFNDQPAIKLVFTEKNPSASKKPAFDAGFKKLGSALIISAKKDGGIFGCEVAHTAHEKSPFSAIGKITIRDFKVTDTEVSGQITTGGEQDAFGQKWDVDLIFSAPLPKGAFAAAVEPETKDAKPADSPPAPAGPKLAVAKLPLPDGALEIEYKQAVGHISFRSDNPVSTVSKDFAAKLKEQGWKDAPGSLMSKTNAILKRKLDAAELTVMVQPADKGCTVKVFTQGLDWTDTPAGAAKPAPAADATSIEAEANRRLEEALKQVPKF
jgi:hypothetical protein